MVDTEYRVKKTATFYCSRLYKLQEAVKVYFDNMYQFIMPVFCFILPAHIMTWQNRLRHNCTDLRHNAELETLC